VFSSGGLRVSRSNVGFSSNEIAHAVGLPLHTIKYWSRTRLVVPSVVDSPGRGIHRRYDVRDALTFAVLAAMREQDVSLQAVRQAQRYLRSRRGRELQDVHARLIWAPGNRRFRNDIAIVNSETEIESLLTAPGQRITPVVVPVGEIFEQIRERLSEIRSARKAAKSKRRRQGLPSPTEKPLRNTERIATTG